MEKHPLSVSLACGGLTFVLRTAGLPLLHEVTGPYREFVLGSAAPEENEPIDVLFSVAPIPPPCGTRLLDAGSWGIYAQGEERSLVFQTPTMADPLYEARFQPGSHEIRIACAPRLVETERGVTGIRSHFRYPLDQVLTMYLLGARGLILHAAGVDLGGSAIVLAGVSGAGKSTVTRLAGAWEGARPLSDDRVILRVQGEGVVMHGTPWPGEAGVARRLQAPAKALIFLEKGDRDGVRRIQPRETLARLLPTASLPWYDAVSLDAGLRASEAILRRLPAGVLTFRPEGGVLEVLRAFLEALDEHVLPGENTTFRAGVRRVSHEGGCGAMAERTIRNILVANRGVPAVRIMHTCRDRKIRSTAVYSTPDRLAHHVSMADAAVHIGEAPPVESYLNMDRIIDAALRTRADAVHAGWGFLAENAAFARRVIDAGLTWIGPPPEVIGRLGDKIEAKQIARAAKVPVIPGIDHVTEAEQVRAWMREENVAFPVMLKAAGGGGGRGMVKVEHDAHLHMAIGQARSEAKKFFGSETVLAEKYVERGRHIEVQIIADKHGNVVHLYERECTIQRRHQKIVEEAPSPTLDTQLREEICATAVRLMREIGYASAGTVEFLFDSETRRFYFLEVNTRLQVEHGITELITGVDIVGLMLDVAEGKPLPFRQEEIRPNRWALEVRLNAEDPRSFNPSFGSIARLIVPQGPNVRVASGVYEGADVPPYYDSLLMLVITAGKDRADAIRVMDRCLGRNLRVEGVKTLQPLLLSIIRHPAFIAGEFSTRFIEEQLAELVATFRDRSAEDEVLKVARYVAEITALGPRGWM